MPSPDRHRARSGRPSVRQAPARRRLLPASEQSLATVNSVSYCPPSVNARRCHHLSGAAHPGCSLTRQMAASKAHPQLRHIPATTPTAAAAAAAAAIERTAVLRPAHRPTLHRAGHSPCRLPTTCRLESTRPGLFGSLCNQQSIRERSNMHTCDARSRVHNGIATFARATSLMLRQKHSDIAAQRSC